MVIKGVPSSSSSQQFSYDNVLPSLDEASLSVDALVADDAAEFALTPLTSHFERISRSSTPSTPPGLSLPHAHPSPILPDTSLAKSQSRIVPTSVPFIPSRSIPAAYIPQAATPLSVTHIPTPAQHIYGPKPSSDVTSYQAQQDVKTLITNIGLSKAIVSQTAYGIQVPLLRPDDFPLLGKSKDKAVVPTGPKGILPASKKVPTPSITDTTPITAPNKNAGKPLANTLTVAIPAPATEKQVVSNEVSTKASSSSSAFPPLPPSVPSSAAIQFPVIKSAPKTLRLVPTTKSDVIPVAASTPQSATSAYPPNFPSRQPSLASLSRLDHPSTPISENVSDNASMTSASLSRPSSPPPMKIGTAPVRSTTKSQQKKNRKDAQKEKEKSDLSVVVNKAEAEVVVAPIMGRKKKQRKEKSNSTVGGSTPAISRAPSPIPETVEADNSLKSEPLPEQNIIGQQKQADTETTAGKAADAKSKGKVRNEETILSEPLSSIVDVAEEPNEKPIPTPASILSDLVSAGLLPDPSKLVLVKTPVSSNTRLDISGDLQYLDHKLDITEEDRVVLQAGKPVRKIAHGSTRIMLTPNGGCIRNLSLAEEERYLELQAIIIKDSGPAAFVPTRHNASSGFTLIGGRAVPNGPPAFFPPIENPTTAIDPVGKIQRDEALSYINQFVLPSLSSNYQLGGAHNANVLDTQMLQARDLTCKSHGANVSLNRGATAIKNEQESTAVGASHGSAHNDSGILATGVENMTPPFAVGAVGAVGRAESNRVGGAPLGNVTLLSLTDSENAMQAAKKETEKLEKSLNQLLKKNRRLLLGAGH